MSVAVAATLVGLIKLVTWGGVLVAMLRGEKLTALSTALLACLMTFTTAASIGLYWSGSDTVTGLSVVVDVLLTIFWIVAAWTRIETSEGPSEKDRPDA